MSLLTTANTYSLATNTQFDEIKSVFAGYKSDLSDAVTKIYLDGNVPYAWTAVGTGTTSTVSSRSPKAADIYNTIFSPSDTSADVPLVDKPNLSYTRITATAANDGAKIVTNLDLTNANWVVLVIKSTGTSIAGKLKIRETGTDESVCAFTTSATANTWEAKIYDFKTDGATGVTVANPVDFSAITEIEITLDTLGTTVDAALFYGINDYKQKLGHVAKIIDDCRLETTLTNTTTVVDQLCANQVKGSAGTAREFTEVVTTTSISLNNLALANGQTLSQKTDNVLELYSNESVNTKTVAAGTATLITGLNIAYIYVDGVGYLEKYHEATNIPEKGFHYDPSSATITLNTALNGKVLNIYIYVQRTGTGFDYNGLKLGYTGHRILPRKTKSGNIEYWIANKVQVMQTAETAAGEEYSNVELTYKYYPDSQGNYVRRLT